MELIIEDGVNEVNDYAYEGNAEINRVFIPATVTRIGTAAFRGCVNICDVEFEDGQMSLEIGECSFEGCTALREIDLPGRANRFRHACFRNSGLESLTIGHEGDFIANQDSEKFAGCPAESELDAVIEEERLERVQRLRHHARREHQFPVSDLLMSLHAKAVGMHGIDADALRNLYDHMANDPDFPLAEYSEGYRRVCAAFAKVYDWKTLNVNEVKSIVSGEMARCVATIARGEIFEREWSLDAIERVRYVCANVTEADFGERNLRAEFYRCFTRIKHHAAFHRLMAMAHPEEFVQLPAISVLVPLYAWLTGNNPPTVEQADWCVLSRGVRSVLSRMLPNVDIYKAGVFAWFMADAFRNASSGERAIRKERILGWMRELGMID